MLFQQTLGRVLEVVGADRGSRGKRRCRSGDGPAKAARIVDVDAATPLILMT